VIVNSINSWVWVEDFIFLLIFKVVLIILWI
jgi:hypothetical protein